MCHIVKQNLQKGPLKVLEKRTGPVWEAGPEVLSNSLKSCELLTIAEQIRHSVGSGIAGVVEAG
jgi:hypothetical protein